MLPTVEFDSTFWWLLIGISVLSATISLIAVLRLKKKIEKRSAERKKQVALPYQRERLENKSYELSQQLVSTPERFIDTNGLLLTIHSDIQRSNVTRNDWFFQELGIQCDEIQVEDHFITCLMPFHKSFDKKYEVIRDTCIRCGFTCTRSDDKFVPGNILKYTVELILKSEIIIAVIDGRNPNVSYEIGIAHTIGKNVILVADYSKVKEIPFNLQSNRFILYKNWGNLEQQLEKVLNSVR